MEKRRLYKWKSAKQDGAYSAGYECLSRRRRVSVGVEGGVSWRMGRRFHGIAAIVVGLDAGRSQMRSIQRRRLIVRRQRGSRKGGSCKKRSCLEMTCLRRVNWQKEPKPARVNHKDEAGMMMLFRLHVEQEKWSEMMIMNGQKAEQRQVESNRCL